MKTDIEKLACGEPRVKASPEQELANAIVRRAAIDYRKALKKLKKDSMNKAAQYKASECEQFFCSSWFEELTEVDGKYLISRIREEQQFECA